MCRCCYELLLLLWVTVYLPLSRMYFANTYSNSNNNKYNNRSNNNNNNRSNNDNNNNNNTW